MLQGLLHFLQVVCAFWVLNHFSKTPSGHALLKAIGFSERTQPEWEPEVNNAPFEEEMSRLSTKTSRPGMENVSNCCYMNALLASLSGIPLVYYKTVHQFQVPEQGATSDAEHDKTMLLAVLARVMIQLNGSGASVNPSMNLMQTVRGYMSWKFGGLECVLEFWQRLLDALPEKLIDGLFAVNVEHVNRYGGRYEELKDYVLSQGTQKEYGLMVSLANIAETQPLKLSEMIADGFCDTGAEYIIEPTGHPVIRELFAADQASECPEFRVLSAAEEPLKFSIPMTSTIHVSGVPVVLPVMIHRGMADNQPDNRPVLLDAELAINGCLFVRRAVIIYQSRHYTAYVYDEADGIWYHYDDERVGAVCTDQQVAWMRIAMAHDAVMAFYVNKADASNTAYLQPYMDATLLAINV